MEYISEYPWVEPPTMEEASAQYAGDYYQRPSSCGWGYRWKEEGIVTDSSHKKVHLEEGALSTLTWMVSPFMETGDSLLWCGYKYISHNGEVVAELYMSSAGNWEAVVYDRDKGVVTLLIDSRRHGRPRILSNDFIEKEPLRVLLYKSWRGDRPWWEAGLGPSSQDY